MKKRMIQFCVALLLTASLVGCGLTNPFQTGRNYETEDFSIQMLTGMKKVDYEGYNYLFQRFKPEVVLLALEETFEYIGIDNTYSTEDYLGMVKEANGLADQNILKDETTGLNYVIFETDVEEESYSYVMFATKTDDAFWLFQIGCLTTDFTNNQATIMEWANSLKMK